MIDYKFNERNLIEEFQSYIDSTYKGHYATNKFQSTEVIIERGHGTGFCMGNVDKYSNRYGKKGSREDARKDLMKVLHYALIQLYIHDTETAKEQTLDIPDDLTIDLSNSDTISLSGMYNVDNMGYNNIDSVTVDLDSVTTLTYGNSIDDATPEEWDRVSKKNMGNKK
jgi:hypothetical protein